MKIVLFVLLVLVSIDGSYSKKGEEGIDPCKGNKKGVWNIQLMPLYLLTPTPTPIPFVTTYHVRNSVYFALNNFSNVPTPNSDQLRKIYDLTLKILYRKIWLDFNPTFFFLFFLETTARGIMGRTLCSRFPWYTALHVTREWLAEWDIKLITLQQEIFLDSVACFLNY